MYDGRVLRLTKDKKGWFYIINLYGDVLICESCCIQCVGAYITKYGIELKDVTKYVKTDLSPMVYDVERDTYTTENVLKEREYSDSETFANGGSFAEYMAEITGKNGTCEYI